MTRLYLVRHGKTAANESGRVMGHEPEPLSVAGREDVRALAAWLSNQGPFAALVSSEMERARETAEIIATALGREYAIEPGLNEPAFDGWIGKSVEQLAREDARFKRYLTDPTEVPIEGELTLRSLVARAVRAIHHLALAHPGEPILAVSHGDIMRGVIASYMGIALERMFRLWIDTASVSVLEVDSGGSGRLRLLNWVPAAPDLRPQSPGAEFRTAVEPEAPLPAPSSD
jgi:broad specificity phosphatase PhoE